MREWWGGSVEGRGRAYGRRNRGEGSAAVDRGGPRKRGGPRRRRAPRDGGKRGSAEERGPAPPGRWNRGEGAALFNAKYRDPANCIGGRLVNAPAKPHSRVQSRAAKLPRI
ncbi:hypothetical protein niasHT_018808 [Heterodera trifolii]|uniref:Uncharacterized protein n=1 Tax=Heterodera trifolii TaxID=157864 RepID=A0ABD2KXI4_9BILA